MTATVERTPRDYLLMYARRALAFPHMDVSDEVADMSPVRDWKTRERWFDALCSALADGDTARAESALDALQSAKPPAEPGPRAGSAGLPPSEPPAALGGAAGGGDPAGSSAPLGPAGSPAPREGGEER